MPRRAQGRRRRSPAPADNDDSPDGVVLRSRGESGGDTRPRRVTEAVDRCIVEVNDGHVVAYLVSHCRTGVVEPVGLIHEPCRISHSIVSDRHVVWCSALEHLEDRGVTHPGITAPGNRRLGNGWDVCAEELVHCPAHIRPIPAIGPSSGD